MRLVGRYIVYSSSLKVPNFPGERRFVERAGRQITDSMLYTLVRTELHMLTFHTL